jgi:hypothetical protein
MKYFKTIEPWLCTKTWCIIHPSIHPWLLHYFRLVSDLGWMDGWRVGESTPGWVREDWFFKCLHSFWFCVLGFICLWKVHFVFTYTGPPPSYTGCCHHKECCSPLTCATTSLCRTRPVQSTSTSSASGLLVQTSNFIQTTPTLKRFAKVPRRI